MQLNMTTVATVYLVLRQAMLLRHVADHRDLEELHIAVLADDEVVVDNAIIVVEQFDTCEF